MQNWKELLTEERKNEDFSHIAFLNKYESIIPGPNRDAKRKRVTRYIENLNFQENQEVVEEEDKIIRETSVFHATEHTRKFVAGVDRKIRFAIISDTHFGSKYVQMTYLNEFYNICKQEGIAEVYHCGDITDGENMRPGHVYENYIHGAVDHIDNVVKHYPKIEGITTHFITGNHDASFRKLCGLDIGISIEAKRPDMHYLGRDICTVNLTDNCSMMLRHPWDGSAYALSYKPQKIIEAMRDASIRPDILCIGHYHKIEYSYYLGIHCLQTGCFQGATPFTVGKGIRVSMGGWIIELDVDKEGKLIAITPKAITFKDDIKDDWKNFV